MKSLIALLALTFAAHTASATNEFTARYVLETFEIGAHSTFFPASHEIAGGMVEMSTDSKQLKLVIYPKSNCPEGAVCIAIIPPPIEIVVPVIYVGSGFCGGRIITAEINHLTANGGLFKVEVVDDSTNFCNKMPRPENLPPVSVVVTEINPAHHMGAAVVSVMYGSVIKAQN